MDCLMHGGFNKGKVEVLSAATNVILVSILQLQLEDEGLNTLLWHFLLT